MLSLVWSTYGSGFMCFILNWCELVGIILSDMMIMALSSTTWSIMIIFVVDLCEVWAYLPTCEVIKSMCSLSVWLKIMLDYDYNFMCIVLGFMYGCSYVPMLLYDGYIYRMT